MSRKSNFKYFILPTSTHSNANNGLKVESYSQQRSLFWLDDAKSDAINRHERADVLKRERDYNHQCLSSRRELENAVFCTKLTESQVRRFDFRIYLFFIVFAKSSIEYKLFQ